MSFAHPGAVFPRAAGTPDSGAGGLFPLKYATTFLAVFYMTTIFQVMANTDYEKHLSDNGDSVIIRQLPNIAIVDQANMQKINYEQLTNEALRLPLDRGKGYGFILSDDDQKQTDLDIESAYATHAASLMQVEVDKVVLSEIYAQAHAANMGATAGLESGNVNLGTVGAPVLLTASNIVDEICKVSQVMNEQNVPTDMRTIAITPWMNRLIKTSELKDASLTGDAKSILRHRSDYIGDIDGMSLLMSNNLKKVTDGAGPAWHAIASHKLGITFAAQLKRQESLRDKDVWGDLHRGRTTFGFMSPKPSALVDWYVAQG